jgi:subtilisin family serine protease
MTAMLRLAVAASAAIALALAAAFAPAAVAQSARSAATPAVHERQILVMLPLAPPRYRPGSGYAGGYDAKHGSGERQRTAERLAAAHGLVVVDEWPMPSLGVDCFVMEAREPAVTSTRRADIADALARDPRVESAQPVQHFETLAHDDPLFPLQPAAERWHLSALHTVTTGRTTRIAEIDSGVDVAHPDLVGQIELAENFVDGRPYAAELHGTAVAGIIAARANDGIGIAGVAPGAKLLALRACWEDASGKPGASCTSFTLAKALQFAILRKPHVINLSVGGPRDRLLERLLDAALEAGIVIVGAADPRDPQSLPASHPRVLRVVSDGDARPLPDALRAPGRDIPAPIPGAKWNFVTGSSFAAAHVSGIVALLHELDRGIGLTRLRDLLRGPQLARDGSPAGAVLVDACSAIERVARSTVCVGFREARAPEQP